MPWPTDPRFASYFLPGYPAAIAAVMAAMRPSTSPTVRSPIGLPSTPSGAGTISGVDYSPGGGCGGGGFLSGLVSSSGTSPAAVHPPPSAFYSPPWDCPATSAGSMFGSPCGINNALQQHHPRSRFAPDDRVGGITGAGGIDNGQAFVSRC